MNLIKRIDVSGFDDITIYSIVKRFLELFWRIKTPEKLNK